MWTHESLNLQQTKEYEFIIKISPAIILQEENAWRLDGIRWASILNKVYMGAIGA